MSLKNARGGKTLANAKSLRTSRNCVREFSPRANITLKKNAIVRRRARVKSRRRRARLYITRICLFLCEEKKTKKNFLSLLKKKRHRHFFFPERARARIHTHTHTSSQRVLKGERRARRELRRKKKRNMTFDPRTRRTGNVAIASSLLCFSGFVYYYAVTQGRKKLDLDVLEAVERRKKEKESMHEKKKKTKRNLWRGRDTGIRDDDDDDDAGGGGSGGGVSGDDGGKSRWFWRSS